ncbi:MAG: FtsX-like permease family protein, partial [Acidobacteriota bacterium]
GYGAAGAAPRQSTIIGVVDDVRYVTASEVTQPELFYSYRQLGRRLPVQTITMLVRTSGDPRRTADVLRAAVRAADERLVADAVAPLEQRLLTTLARPRLYAVLLGGLAAAALIIATVGLFGSLSYSVSLRSSELALRGALGATRADILRLVLRQGLTPALAGLAAGMLASIWLMRLLSSQLYGVTPHDMLTFTLVPLSILFCAGLACVVPARRAARLDPLRLLRDR